MTIETLSEEIRKRIAVEEYNQTIDRVALLVSMTAYHILRAQLHDVVTDNNKRLKNPFKPAVVNEMTEGFLDFIEEFDVKYL